MKAMIPKQHGAWAMLLIPFYSAWSREARFSGIFRSFWAGCSFT